MHWFGGSIAEAVNLSKQKNAIFVVFVEGDNELSVEMAATIDDASVLTRLSDQANFLAIKLKSGSNNYTHFAQIYQFVPVPSLFFIGRNGTPLEVVCAGVQPDNLAARIDRILDEHKKEKQPTSLSSQPSTSAVAQSSSTEQATTTLGQPSTNTAQEPSNAGQAATNAGQASTNAGQATANFIRAEAVCMNVETCPIPETSGATPPKMAKTEITKSGKEYEVVCEGDVCVRRLRVKPDEPGPSGAPAPAPAPAAGAALETQQVTEPQPPAVEDTSSLEDRMERVKELIEARKKEKIEKEKELEKQKEKERRALGQGVAELKQWQQDQELKHMAEERKREKLENNLARQRILEQIAQDRAERRARDLPAPPPPPPQPHTAVGDAGSRARIQFKLPDGSSHTAHFAAAATLRDVTQYVADNLHLSASSFALWTAFPRRELCEPDASLRRLQLSPSAALLVLPRRAAAVTQGARPSSLLAFLTQLFTTLILTPAQQLYAWMWARVAPPPDPPRATPRAPPRAPPRHNIHRLGEETSRDDDNNTWNGNSTQQM